jgi:hypothetical protein
MDFHEYSLRVYERYERWLEQQEKPLPPFTMNHLTSAAIEEITGRALDTIDEQTGRMFNKFIDKRGEKAISETIEKVLLQSGLTH